MTSKPYRDLGIALSVLIGLAGVSNVARAQGVPTSQLPPASTPLSGSELFPCVQSGVTKKCIASSVSTFPFATYPILINNPSGAFIYATQAYTGTTTAINQYQNILSVGDNALNPVTHFSPTNCFGHQSIIGFCGDEVAFGAFALNGDVSGHDNTAVGDHALAHLSTGWGSTAVGSSAAANIHTSDFVEAFGVSACQNANDYAGPILCMGQATFEVAGSSSQYAAALGFQAGLNVTDVEFSTLVGPAAGYSATTIKYSTLLGESACAMASSIINSICIGDINGPASGAMNNVLWIGGNGNEGNTPIIYGDLSANHVGIGTTSLVSGAQLTLSGPLAFPLNTTSSPLAWIQGGSILSSPQAGALESDGINILYTDRVSVTRRTLAQTGTAVSFSSVTSTSFERPGQTTFANLSTADPTPQVGDKLDITDASACTANTQVTAGGGSTHSCAVVYNGVGWFALVTH